LELLPVSLVRTKIIRREVEEARDWKPGRVLLRSVGKFAVD
jgi:hypothetical protein